MTLANKTNLTIVIFLVLVILMTAFVVLPLFRQIDNNSKSLVVQKENFTVLEASIANLEKFKVLYQELENMLERVDNLFVDSELPVEFIAFLENTSEKHQLEIDILFTSDKKTENDSWSYLNFQITSVGSFPNFLKFLEKLENSPYLIEPQNISVNKLAEGGAFSSDKVKATFSLKVFVK